MRVGTSLVLVVLVSLHAGCAKKLLRENVLATTQSMVGLTISQNAQTQMYEFKFGYARNELFLVPTSKRVINDANDDDAAGTRTDYTGYPAGIECNDPTGTPEVLAEIQVGGSGKQGQGSQNSAIKVYQRLAVGKLAVTSPAATALLANDSETAAAVSRAPEDIPTVAPTEEVTLLRKEVKTKREAAEALLVAKKALETPEGDTLDSKGKIREYAAGKVDPDIPFTTLMTSGTSTQLKALAAALDALIAHNSN